MTYFTNKLGKVSKINVFALFTFLVGVLEIWKPFIPAEYVPYLVPTIAVITFALRTFYPSTGDVIR